MAKMGDFLNEYAANLHVLSVWLVAVGNLFTILIAGLISWKAALLFLFALDCLPMVLGEFRRTEKRETTRVKRLPYKVNGHLRDADEALDLAHKFIGSAIDATEPERHFEMLSRANHELASALTAIKQARSIQGN